MITTEVTASDFWQWLQTSSGYKHNFSYDGAMAVFEHDYDNRENEPDNYDPVAWCCAYSEYDSLEALKNDYNIESLEQIENDGHAILVSENPIILLH